jgi:hypothetical protein
MPTYTAPAIENPAVADHTETDPDTGEEFTVQGEVAMIGIAADPKPVGTYHYNEGANTFTVQTDITLSPIPVGWEVV